MENPTLTATENRTTTATENGTTTVPARRTISSYQKSIAERLRRAMDTKGLSQQGISAITQVSTSTISEILNGRRNFGEETLQTLSRALANMEGNKEVFTSLRQFSRLQKVATRTREDQLFTLAVGNTGIGKTTTIQQLYYEAPKITRFLPI